MCFTWPLLQARDALLRFGNTLISKHTTDAWKQGAMEVGAGVAGATALMMSQKTARGTPV